jgi:hypothetical protein
MATLYVAEFDSVGGSGNFVTQAANMPPLAEQTVAIGGSSTQSSAFNASTKFLRIHTDAICSVAVGTSPTATAANMRLAANQTEYLTVKGGAKIAVITNA